MMAEGAKTKFMDATFMGRKCAITKPFQVGRKKTMGRVCHELASPGFEILAPKGLFVWYQAPTSPLAPWGPSTWAQ